MVPRAPKCHQARPTAPSDFGPLPYPLADHRRVVRSEILRSRLVQLLTPLIPSPPHRFSATYLVSRYSPMPSKPPSRPKPDCLTPPKGAAGLETTPWLSPIIPVSSLSQTRSARERSRVYTYATSPYCVLLAASTACSSPAKVATGATGPKISSAISSASSGTSASTVGAKK